VRRFDLQLVALIMMHPTDLVVSNERTLRSQAAGCLVIVRHQIECFGSVDAASD
jgi:hypothetical protein